MIQCYCSLTYLIYIFFASKFLALNTLHSSTVHVRNLLLWRDRFQKIATYLCICTTACTASFVVNIATANTTVPSHSSYSPLFVFIFSSFSLTHFVVVVEIEVRYLFQCDMHSEFLKPFVFYFYVCMRIFISIYKRKYVHLNESTSKKCVHTCCSNHLILNTPKNQNEIEGYLFNLIFFVLVWLANVKNIIKTVVLSLSSELTWFSVKSHFDKLQL